MQNGSTQPRRQSDVLDPSRARALLISLGRSETIEPGDTLPPFFHQLYFWDPFPPAILGRDGHPRTGAGLIPNMGLPRRMWAGGRLSFENPLLAGAPAEKVSTIEATTRKDGRTGPLAFVTLRHEIRQNGLLCVTEWQDLVYREDPQPGQPTPIAPQAPKDEQSSRRQAFDSTLLFRYSALTFNGHRIHYDLDYARTVEMYSGLVVHGPLLAQLMMLMAAEELGALKHFSFRATSPLMHDETASICRRGSMLWVRAADGRLCMTGEAETRP